MDLQLLQKISNCVNTGEVLSTIFIEDKQWFSAELMEQMWLYYMTRDKTFQEKYNLTEEAKDNIEKQLNASYLTIENVNLYESYFKGYFTALSSLNTSEFAVLVCSSNVPAIEISYIVFTGTQFRFIQHHNSNEMCNSMNDILRSNGKSGRYCHFLLCKL